MYDKTSSKWIILKSSKFEKFTTTVDFKKFKFS